MHRYSKLRFVLALVLCFLGFQFFKIGFSFKGSNSALLPYIQRGVDQKLSDLEAEYQMKGLKEGVDAEDFERELGALKTDMEHFKKGVLHGKNYLVEIAVVMLGYLLCFLFLVNAYLVLRKSVHFDRVMKTALYAVWVFWGSFYAYIIVQVSFIFSSTERIMRLVTMIADVEDAPAVRPGRMLRESLTSPEAILFTAAFLLFFWGIPLLLYAWLKNRERSLSGSASIK